MAKRVTYTLTYNGITIPVSPKDDGVTYTYSKSDGMARLRKNMNGALIFYNDYHNSIFDYNVIKIQSWDTEYIIDVYFNDVLYYRGRFVITDCEVDEDRCTITASPVTYDDYYDFLLYIDRKTNILKRGLTRQTVSFNLSAYEIEKKVVSTMVTIGAPTLPSAYVNDDNYLLYSILYIQVGTDWAETKEYWREYQYTVSSSVPTGWYDPGGNPQSDGLYKWVRPYLGLLPTTTTTNAYTSKKIGNGKWLFTVDASSANVVYGLQSNDRCLYLTSVLGLFLADTSLTNVISDFFTGSMSYVIDNTPGLSYPASYPNLNPVQHLLLLQRSDIRDTSDEATIGEISFDELIRYLYDIFQVEWWIESGVLRIEHISWKALNPQQGLDLTKLPYKPFIIDKNKYSYAADRPKLESWEFGEAGTDDFIGQPIEYDGYSYEQQNVEHDVTQVATDIKHMFSRINEVSKDGWILFQTYLNGTTYDVGIEKGKRTNVDMLNGHLSVANLQHYYWRHDRYVPTGDMNGNSITFASTKKVRQQDGINIPFTMDFDPNKLIKTELGWGEVTEATVDLNKELIKMTIAHDW